MTILKLGQMRRSIGTLLIGTLTLSGCTRWQAHTTPGHTLREQQYGAVVVHPLEGPEMYVLDPRITADSLHGVERIVLPHDRRQGYVVRPVSIPLSAIRTLETPSTTYAPLLVVVIMATAVFLAAVAQADFGKMGFTSP